MTNQINAEKPQAGCFPAGTLVHTQEGLRPIDAIQVGDYVLSKPENGGELAYKRVTKTFVRENSELFGMEFRIIVVDGIDKYISLVTTAEHPFWVPTLRVKDPSVQFGGMDIPHGKWVTPSEMFKYEENYYKGKGPSVTYYLSTYDGKQHMVALSGPICMATNSTRSRFNTTGPDFGVVYSYMPDTQREQMGGGLTLEQRLFNS